MNNNALDMTGKTVVVTGAAGFVGRSYCHAIRSLGASLVAIDRSSAALEELKLELEDSDHGFIDVHDIDFGNAKMRSQKLTAVAAHYDTIDVVLNNAAFTGDSSLQGWATRFEEQTAKTFSNASEVNLTSCFEVVQKFLGALRKSDTASVVNVASIYGVIGPDYDLYADTDMANPAGYAASKGGVIQLTKWMATALAPEVRVNCVSPGGIARGQDKIFTERYIKKTPLNRMATESDIVDVIVFLSSNMSRYMTGQNIVVDGGYTVK